MLKIQQQPDKNVKASRASIYRWLKDYQNSNCDIRSLVSKVINAVIKKLRLI